MGSLSFSNCFCVAIHVFALTLRASELMVSNLFTDSSSYTASAARGQVEEDGLWNHTIRGIDN
jgi:hypothetical protein